MTQKKFEIRKILIPYDFSETAALSLEHAVFMAKLLKAEIILLHIVETVTFTSAISHALSGFEKKIENTSNAKLDEIAKEIHNHSGIVVSVLTEVGRIYKKIVSIAKDIDADIIIMGTHGVSGYQRFNVGSNTSRVVESAPCPVISVQTHAKNIGFKKIVLPIDESPSSRQKVNHVIEMANHYNAHVYIVGLINFNSEELKRKFRIKVEQVEEFLAKFDISYESKFVQGDNLAKMTMSIAEEIDADLIVIMTEQEPSITGFFMGTYASQVVNHSKVPIMSVRPAEIDPDKITVSF
jgi:nucleotide-binding universal stress UspA family protein